MPGPAEKPATPLRTIGSLVGDMAARFAEAGIDSPRLDARLLISHVTGIDPGLMFARANAPVDEDAARKIGELAARRLRREPVSRILGKREFWGLEFALSHETLDPRPDTETLVSAALELKARFENGAIRILDLGTGTGCILLALLQEWREASGVGTDISSDAVATASSNADRLGLHGRAKFLISDWTRNVTGTFQIVVSNPPYIAECESDQLSPEVSLYDPPGALYGGEDGLAAYRVLIPSAKQVLESGGYLVLEVGATQKRPVEEILRRSGFAAVYSRRDLAGVERCLVAQKD